MPTWKQIRDRECLGASRGQGIFVRELSKKLDPHGILDTRLLKRRPEHKTQKKRNQDDL